MKQMTEFLFHSRLFTFVNNNNISFCIKDNKSPYKNVWNLMHINLHFLKLINFVNTF